MHIHVRAHTHKYALFIIYINVNVFRLMLITRLQFMYKKQVIKTVAMQHYTTVRPNTRTVTVHISFPLSIFQ